MVYPPQQSPPLFKKETSSIITPKSVDDILKIYAGTLLKSYVTIDGKLTANDQLTIDDQLYGTILNDQMVQKATFDILGLMEDPRFLNLKCDDPGAGTMYDISGKGNDGTYQGTLGSSDRAAKGMGWGIQFNGSSDYISIADDGSLSFGNGTNDEAVTWFGVMEVAAGGDEPIICKYFDGMTGIREWFVGLDTDNQKLEAKIYDEGLNKECSRIMDASLSAGWHTYVVPYSGVGGGSAADGISIYIDGSVVASTATNNGDYVAMTNTGTGVLIGKLEEYLNDEFFSGKQACNGIDGSAWSAYKIHRFDQLARGLYGL